MSGQITPEGAGAGFPSGTATGGVAESSEAVASAAVAPEKGPPAVPLPRFSEEVSNDMSPTPATNSGIDELPAGAPSHAAMNTPASGAHFAAQAAGGNESVSPAASATGAGEIADLDASSPATNAESGVPMATIMAAAQSMTHATTTEKAGKDETAPLSRLQTSDRDTVTGAAGQSVTRDQIKVAHKPKSAADSDSSNESNGGGKDNWKAALNTAGNPDANDGVKPALAATARADTIPPGAIAVPSQHSPAAAKAPEAADNPPASPPAPPEPSAVLPSPALHPAQVLARMDRTELHLGLQTEAFGAIRLHTSVSDEGVGAIVSTAHAGLRAALVAEAPILEKAMAQHAMRLDSLRVDTGGAGSTSNSSAQGEPGTQRQALPSQPDRPSPLPRTDRPAQELPASVLAHNVGGRLDILI